MEKVTAEEWQAAIRLAKRQEDLYIEIDEDQPNHSLLPDEDIEPEVNDEEAAIEPPAKKQILECEHCELKSESPGSFQRHKNSVKYCEHCGKVFCGRHAKRQLESHQKEHDFKPKKAHICDHCKKAFPFPSKLKEHLVWSKCGRL